ncbi:MAG TPA: hypothetical protein ENJ00_07140 [Phycisphaerales bacterium]|nr:hypothetical protein [Phycisphaerales bacterium]
MTPIRRFLETLHLTLAGLWLGVLVMTGVSAAIIFPTMHRLNPNLPGFMGYTGEHWRLAAGHIAAPIFWVADAIQFGCALLCGLSLGIILISPAPWRQPVWSFVRLFALLVAIGLLAYSLLVLGPRMNANLAEFWLAAEAGDMPKAEAARALFDADHPKATTVMACSFVAVFVLLTVGIYAALGASAPNNPRPTQRLETPDLAR